MGDSAEGVVGLPAPAGTAAYRVYSGQTAVCASCHAHHPSTPAAARVLACCWFAAGGLAGFLARLWSVVGSLFISISFLGCVGFECGHVLWYLPGWYSNTLFAFVCRTLHSGHAC